MWKGDGGRKPPNLDMSIALWIAQLLLDYIKSSNDVMVTELEHQIRRQKELEASLQALKALNDMYDHSVNALEESNGRLMASIEELKREQAHMKVRKAEILIRYRDALDQAGDSDVLRGDV